MKPQLIVTALLSLAAQIEAPRAMAAGSEWYFSWGYSRDYWAPSDIHISQPTLGNDFTVHQVEATDFAQWDTGLLDKGITTPQWNLRIGRFIDQERNYALELNVDHSKYTAIADQTAHITGMIGHDQIDTYRQLTADYFRYWLHNGANHIMVNIVRRVSLLGEVNRPFGLSALLKVGAAARIKYRYGS